jgi:hypothetical protein
MYMCMCMYQHIQLEAVASPVELPPILSTPPGAIRIWPPVSTTTCAGFDDAVVGEAGAEGGNGSGTAAAAATVLLVEVVLSMLVIVMPRAAEAAAGEDKIVDDRVLTCDEAVASSFASTSVVSCM